MGCGEVKDAVSNVLEQVRPMPTVECNALMADGCILAAPVYSQEPLPPFRASIMDGYAVVSSDGTGQFQVVQRIAAGKLPVQAIHSGQVAYITTGSAVPDGADAVVKIEDTAAVDSSNMEEQAVKILKSVEPGQNIRPIGSDIAPNEKLADAGTMISAAELGLFATAGITTVPVVSQPTIGVLSTGSELVDAFEPTAPGKIRDANRPMLLSLLRHWNIQPVDLGKCDDTEDAVENKILKSLEQVDVLITSGGVSMGDHDLIKPLLARLGHVQFGRLMMKPGKPTTFATIEMNGTTKYVFGLPGNPVSAFTTCHLLVHPAVNRLRGVTSSECRQAIVHAKLDHDLKLDKERPEYHRAIVSFDVSSGQFIAKSTGRQISSRLLSCVDSNAFLCLPKGESISGGEFVEALLLDRSFLNQKTQVSNESKTTNRKSFRAAILTVSDRVSKGETEDLSGPAMRHLLENMTNVDMEVIASAVVPDEMHDIQRVIQQWTDHDHIDFILTSGGTGFTPRDVTPEAIKPLLEKEIPGFVMAMLQAGIVVTPMALLSRPIAGIRKHSIIVTLPGKPKAVKENFQAVETVLPHALHLAQDAAHDHHRPHP